MFKSMKNRSVLSGIILFALILTLGSCGDNSSLRSTDNTQTGQGYADGSSECSSEFISEYNDVVSETPTYRNYSSYYSHNSHYSPYGSNYFYGPYYWSYWPRRGHSHHSSFSFGWSSYARDGLLTTRYRAAQFKEKYNGVVCEASVKPQSQFDDPYIVTIDAATEMDNIIVRIDEFRG